MKEIPKTFRKNGYSYELRLYSQNVAVYEGTRNNCKTFEVMIIRKFNEDYPMFNIVIGDIRLPSNEDWGRYGWTYKTFDEAIEKAKSLKKIS